MYLLTIYWWFTTSSHQNRNQAGTAGDLG